VILLMATAEKTNSPVEHIIETVDGAGPCASAASHADAIECWGDLPMAPGEAKNTLITPRKNTLDWLVDFNNASPQAIEGLYLDLGHGGAPADSQDATVVVRQVFRPVRTARTANQWR
jgi:hypothetical protein